MCKKHRGGNAEQYNADKKYKEAVAEAVEHARTTHGPDLRAGAVHGRAATLDDLREAVETADETERIARRVCSAARRLERRAKRRAIAIDAKPKR